MKAVVALCVLAVGCVSCNTVAVPAIPATTLVRTPQFDSAVIRSSRLGGNFAYRTDEGHAYAAISPVVQRVSQPVAVSYTPYQVQLGHAAVPVAVSQPIYTTHSLVSQPFIGAAPAVVAAPGPAVVSAPVVAQSPLLGAIASLPAVAADPAPAPAPAPAPVEGTAVDADTVAVESA